MSSPASPKDPSTLFNQSNAIKRSIITSYWIVIFLSIPLWWYTTSIPRLSLPETQIHSRTQQSLTVPIDVCVEDNSAVSILRDSFSEQLLKEPRRWAGVKLQFHHHEECPEIFSCRIRNGPRLFIRDNEIYLPLYDKQRLSSAFGLFASLVNPSQEATNYDSRVVQFSPQYRLAFTLLNEDASFGSSVSNWDIQAGLSSRIKPILDKLRPLHNFTIESQVQYHGHLSFPPGMISDGSYGLTQEDLTVFINSAEWSLSSSASNDPVLHFILFIPSTQHRPLHILTSDGQVSPSKSFLLPQWGGITIYNPPIDESNRNLDLPSQVNGQIFQEFSRQLLALLGVPPLPSGVEQHASDASVISTWQIDALMRRRAFQNSKGARNTLTSIVKLVNQIENMPLKDDVKDDVQGALHALEKMFSATSLRGAFQNSADAMTLASRAFFNPGMLALLYFPAEHKYAVYTPLFASAIIPLFVAALRELIAWRRERRERREARSVKTD